MLPRLQTATSFLQVVDHCLSKEKVLFAVHRISPLDQARQPHSIQVAVTCAHTEDDLQKAAKALEGAVQQVSSWGLADRKATCSKHGSCCEELVSSWHCARDAHTGGLAAEGTSRAADSCAADGVLLLPSGFA